MYSRETCNTSIATSSLSKRDGDEREREYRQSQEIERISDYKMDKERDRKRAMKCRNVVPLKNSFLL